MKMLFLQNPILPNVFSPSCVTKIDRSLHPLSSFNIQNPGFESSRRTSHLGFFLHSPISSHHIVKSVPCFVVSRNSHTEPEPSSKHKGRPKERSPRLKKEITHNEDKAPSEISPKIIPRKPRRGRRSEAVEVEDFIRDSLEKTLASIQQQDSSVLENKENVLKDRVNDKSETQRSDEEEEEEEEGTRDSRQKKMVIEEESDNWPLDADVGWGIRASEYFEQHPIKNVVGEDGVEIDWEGEIDDNWVQEINCLEWESFAFHPSPIIVLVFERYHRATENWKNLKELEKAIKVYWSAKDRLPPRAVKVDINIERDLAYALKVKECPQILFLRGNRIVYREKELRTADELVKMIAFFYYNAKKPSWIDDKAMTFL
ncbi:hypothetical protein L6164_016703 [Bauhinia variegata]|uniref:Uncharacterized protein n=1 Tax=Bauhinia variegata TaxID=167791 RepID=A0ACB9NAN2_BAUVA|nr:hypothetical protein L6164_016703 [Bauhinia variegata]